METGNHIDKLKDVRCIDLTIQYSIFNDDQASFHSSESSPTKATRTSFYFFTFSCSDRTNSFLTTSNTPCYVLAGT